MAATQPPRYDCDLVMKGGITSGIVYPQLVSKLKDEFRFHNIGGTSAGAIAASLTAAAEYRRQATGDTDGFDKLNTLPQFLSQDVGGKTRLFRLFTPQPQTKRVFEVLTAPLKPQKLSDSSTTEVPSDTVLNKLWRVLARASTVYPAVPIVTILLGLLYLNLTLPKFETPLATLHLLFTLLSLVVLFIVALAGVFVIDFGNMVITNDLGLCTGKTPKGTGQLAFTDWCEGYLDDLAFGDLSATLTPSKTRRDPLTFGDLEQHGIRLNMFTSCVSRGVPLIVPFKQKSFYFRPSELLPFFSDRIVNHLMAKARVSKTIDQFNVAHELTGNEKLYALPEPEDLPVAFGVRFSMSFPVLFSALPLYMRFNLPSATGDSLQVSDEEVSGKPMQLERVYFTDGGICSNFPIDFFDQPLPSRPTFAIDIQGIDTEYGPRLKSTGVNKKVWVPKNNGQGTQLPWKLFGAKQGWGKLFGYLTAMMDTGFTWRDNLQSVAPASRNRICHIQVWQEQSEGGLNLSMPEALIQALSERGLEGGALLLEAFAAPDAPGWTNHRTQRLRTVASNTMGFLEGLSEAYTQRGGLAPESYQDCVTNESTQGFATTHQRAFAKLHLAKLVRWIADVKADPHSTFHDNAPRPASLLRTLIRPEDIDLK